LDSVSFLWKTGGLCPKKPEVTGNGTFERRFLVSGKLPALRGPRPETIQIGFLSVQGDREVSLVKRGSRRFLVVAEGRGRLLRRNRIHLERSDFDALWALTESSRLTKVRRTIRTRGLTVALEKYTSLFPALEIAGVVVPAKGFEKPAFLGEEVTRFEEFGEASLASNGRPPVRDGRTQAGALPFLYRNGILHLVLVTSSSGTRWILPKGGLEHGMTRPEVALMEAAEEAGVIGVVEPGLKAQCRLEDQRLLHLYPLRVATLLQHWPERAVRRRVVLPLDRALPRIRDVGLAQSVRRLARKLEP
jgi:8-oxo-dGTP pyrophosphatase MutT (NUDIX family)/CYTH domain-containing protein